MDLRATAERVMVENGFDAEITPDARQQAAALDQRPPAIATGPAIHDLRDLPWSSIDNDTSRDLDQLEVAERQSGGSIKIMIAIADVDAFVVRGTPIDRFAAKQTTTVYTGAGNFPMLPEQLSTRATSLLEGSDEAAMVVESIVSASGHVESSSVYRAIVRNKAQLTYNAVGPWLEDRGPIPSKLAASKELEAQVRLQDQAAQALQAERYRHGALNIDTNQDRNRATELIEDFMIASNEVVARLLEPVSSIRRVVKTPKRWDRIVALAAEGGGHLPAAPDSKALNEFLVARRRADPDHFPDLSLAVIKLMGPGEYVLERPGDPELGHFGLAVEDYTHSTAPNRRFADLVTQRLVKAVISKQPSPYSDEELGAIAAHCTERGDAARKVEREMAKRIAAQAMSSRIGETFNAIVTGVTPRGTFVRTLGPRVDGLLAQGQHGADVGDKLRVRLVSTDVGRGFIDFARV